LGGCPLAWKSQLVSKVCLSSVESECATIGLAVRQLLSF
jgi:hypothetical protein